MSLPKIKYPCYDGWDSNAYSNQHKGIDIGWLSDISKNGMTPIYACDDGEIVFEGYYPEVINGITYKPIGTIIKHNWDKEYDYYSIYWHLSNTIINKGDKVTKGQRIGTKGNTGCSYGVHLHFQIIKIPKGKALPASSEWSKYSINPTDMIEVYSDQIFRPKGGNYTLAYHDEEEQPDYKKLYEEAQEKLDKIKAILA